MKEIKILDCTLRDGGYCNNWNFGKDNINNIIDSLVKANIDIIECGYVSEKNEPNVDRTQYSSINDVEYIIPKERANNIFVCMIDYGKFTQEKITLKATNNIDGFRIAFHKENYREAVLYCKEIAKKGYKVFVQPMATMNYSDQEFLELIDLVNESDVYAFYIVDSFGGMRETDLLRLFYITEHNLRKDICIGFHSHNNMQLAYSNAKKLISLDSERTLIIDSSIFGMGRGAGNLNTELLVEHMNSYEKKEYVLSPILTTIDNIINRFYSINRWGYSVPNYLSARHNVHPDYANYLAERQTLLIDDMDQIFAMMPKESKGRFEKEYIEDLYYRYMEKGKSQEQFISELKNILNGRKILLIAPGKSITDEVEKIKKYIEMTNPVCISVNFNPSFINVNYIFVSNIRRYAELDKREINRMIITSNIPCEDYYIKTSYVNLLNNVEYAKDNASLMLIKFLIDNGVEELSIAGLDGYSCDFAENYAKDTMSVVLKRATIDARNKAIKEQLSKYQENIKLQFITKSIYVENEN